MTDIYAVRLRPRHRGSYETVVNAFFPEESRGNPDVYQEISMAFFDDQVHTTDSLLINSANFTKSLVLFSNTVIPELMGKILKLSFSNQILIPQMAILAPMIEMRQFLFNFIKRWMIESFESFRSTIQSNNRAWEFILSQIHDDITEQLTVLQDFGRRDYFLIVDAIPLFWNCERMNILYDDLVEQAAEELFEINSSTANRIINELVRVAPSAVVKGTFDHPSIYNAESIHMIADIGELKYIPRGKRDKLFYTKIAKLSKNIPSEMKPIQQYKDKDMFSASSIPGSCKRAPEG